MSSPYSYAYACLPCRRSFKRPGGSGAPEQRPCPRCGAAAINLGRHFKAPPADDTEQWEKVAFLVSHGFPFHTLHDPDTHLQVGYPRTLKEARSFVRKYRRLAVGRGRPQNNEMQLTRSAMARRRGPRS
jgi:hypothetical protein